MIVVTGATGHLGRFVVDGLLEEVPAEQVVAAVRSPEKAADFAARGVEVREADYDRPDTLDSAFAGADVVLLISSNDVGNRLPQHRTAVAAAKRAGVRRIVYTSAPRADTSPLVLAPDHKETEAAILESGLPYTILRNNWYSENYEQAIAAAAQTGIVFGSAGEGRVASAARADFAAAAAAVLVEDGHENATYELGGDVAWSFPEFAAHIAQVAGRPVEYRNLTPADHAAELVKAGLPEAGAGFYAALDGNIANGALSETSGDLQKLIGRPTTPIADTIEAVLKG